MRKSYIQATCCGFREKSRSLLKTRAAVLRASLCFLLKKLPQTTRPDAAFVVEQFLPLFSQLGLPEAESPRPSSRPAQWQDRPSSPMLSPSPPQADSTPEQCGTPAPAPASHPSIGTAMYVCRQR